MILTARIIITMLAIAKKVYDCTYVNVLSQSHVITVKTVADTFFKGSIGDKESGMCHFHMHKILGPFTVHLAECN